MLTHRRTCLSRFRALALFVVVGTIAVSVDCGSYSPRGGATSAVQLRMGDAPADRVLTFEVSAGPISATPSGGAAVTLLADSRRIELAHLSETTEPLSLLSVPQGTYSSMTIKLSNPEVTFINSSGTLTKLEPSFSQSVTINFNPALNITAAASVVNIDLNLINALTFDAQGNVTGVAITANSFTISAAAVAAGEQGDDDDEHGQLENITGMVTAVSGSTFTMTPGQNAVPLTFTTDENTEFKDGASLGTILNTIVDVEGITQSNGGLYAKEVESVENEAGMEAEGIITQVVGNPATQLSFVAQDGSGAGMGDAKVGGTVTTNVSGAQYRIDQGGMDTSSMGGLPASPNFPFDATTVHSGQRVEVESSSTMSGMSTVAEKVKLRQQTLSGIVSGLGAPVSTGPATFTLTVAPDSAFAMLSGQTTVTVFFQQGTNLHDLASVSNGNTVRVRGLLFFTGSSFNMIAGRIGQ